MSEENSSIVVRDAMLRTFQDMLADVAQRITELPVTCEKCPIYNGLSDLVTKLRKMAFRKRLRLSAWFENATTFRWLLELRVNPHV